MATDEAYGSIKNTRFRFNSTYVFLRTYATVRLTSLVEYTRSLERLDRCFEQPGG